MRIVNMMKYEIHKLLLLLKKKRLKEILGKDYKIHSFLLKKHLKRNFSHVVRTIYNYIRFFN